jgi:hypothetical protein
VVARSQQEGRGLKRLSAVAAREAVLNIVKIILTRKSSGDHRAKRGQVEMLNIVGNWITIITTRARTEKMGWE